MSWNHFAVSIYRVDLSIYLSIYLRHLQRQQRLSVLSEKLAYQCLSIGENPANHANFEGLRP